jgi:hypothetical protein
MDLFLNGKMSESSKRLYTHNLKRLNDNKEITSFSFLKNTDKLMKLLPKNDNTRRTYIISIVVCLKDRKGFKKQLQFWTNKMEEINKLLKDATNKSERYLDNEMKWEDILNNRDKLPKDSIEYVVMCLYTMSPPRRNQDYIMKIGKAKENSNSYDGVNFYFGNYKTKGTYNMQVVPVPEDLKKVLNSYLDNRPFKSNDLLIKKSGNPFSTKDIQLTINKVLGKKIGCTLLRSIYLSNKYGDMVDEMKNDAQDMGTSTSVIQSNYIKSN